MMILIAANPPRPPASTLLLVLGFACLALPPAFAQGGFEPAKRPPVRAAPTDPAARAAWIQEQLEQVLTGAKAARETAIRSLAKADHDGDCVHPLVALMQEKENKKDLALLVAIIRGLGRNGLEIAAPAIADELTHKKKAVRGNAAVSLEYIGSRDRKVLAALRKHVAREKDAAIANHAYRALGRCGVKEAEVRALLLRKALGAKSEFASYGPCIALAYFERDPKVARGVEKLLKKIGVPGGGKSGRGGAANAVKRSLVSWTLANVGDPQSANFVIDELMPRLENNRNPWGAGLREFWNNVARVCDGEKERMPFVEGGVRGAVSFLKGGNLDRYGAETRNLMDEYRKGRESAGFTPKGDNILNDEFRFRRPWGN